MTPLPGAVTVPPTAGLELALGLGLGWARWPLVAAVAVGALALLGRRLERAHEQRLDGRAAQELAKLLAEAGAHPAARLAAVLAGDDPDAALRRWIDEQGAGATLTYRRREAGADEVLEVFSARARRTLTRRVTWDDLPAAARAAFLERRQAEVVLPWTAPWRGGAT